MSSAKISAKITLPSPQARDIAKIVTFTNTEVKCASAPFRILELVTIAASSFGAAGLDAATMAKSRYGTQVGLDVFSRALKAGDHEKCPVKLLSTSDGNAGKDREANPTSASPQVDSLKKLISLGPPGNFDVRHCGLLTVCGVPSNINQDDLDIHHQCPARNSKTTSHPAKGKSVSVPGFLTGVEHNDDKTVKYFLIDVETVTFLGQASGATVPRAEENPTKITDGTPAKLKFTGFFSGDGSPAKGGEPPSKKRKTVADEEAPADAKGEGSSSGRTHSKQH
ncbi:hypothetical protein B0H14DRAFT_2606530 [Mycena olivaceomarginata]|nr:hypothetical protein B0H14DRAFT_2606530 [Mycena olivaceomarginata]